MFYQGKFKPKNPSKYKGDVDSIVYRSSWELRMMKWLDQNPSVIEWNSEEIIIGYRSPIDGKIHRYFTDIWAKLKEKDGKITTYIFEIKPESQTKPPVPKKRRTKRYINEVMTWGINEAKWEAAKSYCKKRGWKFELITEKDLFGYK